MTALYYRRHWTVVAPHTGAHNHEVGIYSLGGLFLVGWIHR
jgi:hypothetical protein